MAIVILGAGEIGYHIALSLSRENREVVLVESDADRADQIAADESDLQTVHGNAADPDVLLRAGLASSDLLVAVTNSDEVNIAACTFAARLAPATRRLARIRHLDTRVHGQLLTADPPLIHAIINPEELCARKIADLIRHPGATDVNWFFDSQAVLVSLPVTAEAPVCGKTLVAVGQERLARELPFLVATIVREQEARVPLATDTLQAGDMLYVATLTSRLHDVLEYFRGLGCLKPMRVVTLFGGGNIGMYLAEMLDDSDMTVKIIEPDERRATMLADRLKRALVLCGEPADKAIFDEEKIADSDAFVAVTKDEEDNMIAALYAKSFGVRLGVAALYRAHLAPLVHRLGVDTVILPQQAAIGNILEYVRAGQVSSVIVLEQHRMEVIETRVPEGARLAHRALRDARLPAGTLLLAVQRAGGETLIPDGGTLILPGDRIAVVSHQRDMDTIARMLAGSRGWLKT